MAKKKTQVEIAEKQGQIGETVKVEIFDITESPKINIFFKITMYDPKIPLVKQGVKKEQVGYTHFWSSNTTLSSRRDIYVTQRPIYKIGENEFKLAVKQNDDFASCIRDLTRIVSEYYEEMRRSETICKNPKVEVSYGSKDLEDKLRRI